MSDSLRTGTKLLSAAFIAGVISTLVIFSSTFAVRFYSGSLSFLIWRGYLLLALGIASSLLLIGGWLTLRPLASARAAPFISAAVAFPIFRLVLTVLSRMFASRGLVMSSLWSFVFLGGLLAAWLALRALSADRMPKPADATALVIGALVVSALVGVAQEWGMATGHASSVALSMFTTLSVLSGLASFLLYGLLLARTRALSTSALASEVTPGAVVTPPLAPVSSGNDFVVGAIWLVGGVVVTGVSFSLAQGGGGHYVVTTGAIAYGLARIIRGLARR